MRQRDGQNTEHSRTNGQSVQVWERMGSGLWEGEYSLLLRGSCHCPPYLNALSDGRCWEDELEGPCLYVHEHLYPSDLSHCILWWVYLAGLTGAGHSKPVPQIHSRGSSSCPFILMSRTEPRRGSHGHPGLRAWKSLDVRSIFIHRIFSGSSRSYAGEIWARQCGNPLLWVETDRYHLRNFSRMCLFLLG